MSKEFESMDCVSIDCVSNRCVSQECVSNRCEAKFKVVTNALLLPDIDLLTPVKSSLISDCNKLC